MRDIVAYFAFLLARLGVAAGPRERAAAEWATFTADTAPARGSLPRVGAKLPWRRGGGGGGGGLGEGSQQAGGAPPVWGRSTKSRGRYEAFVPPEFVSRNMPLRARTLTDSQASMLGLL